MRNEGGQWNMGLNSPLQQYNSGSWGLRLDTGSLLLMKVWMEILTLLRFYTLNISYDNSQNNTFLLFQSISFLVLVPNVLIFLRLAFGAFVQACWLRAVLPLTL